MGGIPRSKAYTETMRDYEGLKKSISDFKGEPKGGIPWTLLVAIVIALMLIFWGKV